MMINISSKSLIFSLCFFFGLLLKDRGNLATNDYVTQQIYGFLDFTTTIGNTVMIFSPSSTSKPVPTSTKSVLHETSTASEKQIIDTTPLSTNIQSTITPSRTITSKSTTLDNFKTTTTTTSNVNNVHASSVKKTNHVTGLITKTGGTDFQNGVTTFHETSIIGTYISGKYAQILRSSSTVYQNRPNSQSLPVEPLFSTVDTTIEPTKRFNSYHTSASLLKRTKPTKNDDVTTMSVSLTENLYTKKRPKFGLSHRYAKKTTDSFTPVPTTLTTKKFQPKRSNSNSKLKIAQNETITTKKVGFKPKSVSPTSASSTTLNNGTVSNFIPKLKLSRESGRWHYKSSPKPRVNIRRQLPQTLAEHLISTTSSTTTTTSEIEEISNDLEVSQDKSIDTNLLAVPEEIRLAKVIDDEDQNNNFVDSVTSSITNSASKSEKKFPVETIAVNISIPSTDSDHLYYEIATIKTPYVFQVGTVKNTRYITVTSTFEKNFKETETKSATFESLLQQPLTENILITNNPDLESADNYNQSHSHPLLAESELITLKPIFATRNENDDPQTIPTPPLETITETLTTTQNVLKTNILPVVYQTESNSVNLTSSMTLIQTYHITRVISATKTVPIVEFNLFSDNSQHLDAAGSEHLPQVDFGDENGADRQRLTNDFDDLKEIDADYDLGAIDEKRVRLLVTKRRLKSLNNNNRIPSPQLPQNLITISNPILKIETVYDTKVLPIIFGNGQHTSYTTISRPIGTFSRTDYEYSTLATPRPLVGMSVPQSHQQPYLPQPLFQPQFTITSTPIVSQTMQTQTDSKILKLTFGARTTMTTIYSTKVVPTLVTTYVTNSMPIQNPGHLYPGYYPPPFAGYPFLG